MDSGICYTGCPAYGNSSLADDCVCFCCLFALDEEEIEIFILSHSERSEESLDLFEISHAREIPRFHSG